jgi:non-specific serine/threonine protein kinase
MVDDEPYRRGSKDESMSHVHHSVPRPHVFISYASVDRERVLTVVDTLRSADVPVWLDKADIQGGTQYGTEIGEGIRNCRALMLMCSAASLTSRNVKQEILLAWRYQRPYLPLMLERTPIPPELEYWLVGFQWIEVLDRPADEWLPRVLDALQRIDLGAASQPSPAAGALTAAPKRATNLPPAVPLIGRERELAEVTALVRAGAESVVTLTGPGGTGKTRLAVQVATDVLDAFQDVVFVPLAPLADSQFVLPALAQTLGVREEGGRPLTDQLIETLSNRRILLVLDNFEHVVEAAGDLGHLLAHCPQLRLLATSRVRLGLYHEQEYPVPPLDLPDPKRVHPIEELAQVGSVALFVQRVKKLKPEFALGESNAAAVAELCVRLDGLPLAIELAAARIKLMTPQAMLARMASALPLLTGGARDLPVRQQTLRNAIAWSYDLLDEDERKLFRRLSVFRGGWTLEAAEMIVGTPLSGEDGSDVLLGLEQLVEHNLVRQRMQDDGTPRFGMLQTIREFGLEQLAASGEAAEAQRRHAYAFVDLSERAAPELIGAEQGAWLQRLETEHDNLRVTASWLLDQAQVEDATRLAAALWRFWWVRCHLAEGRTWLDLALAQPEEAVPPQVRATALRGAGMLAWAQGDFERAVPRMEESLALFRAAGDQDGVSRALASLGVAFLTSGQFDEAQRAHEECLAIDRALGDEHAVAFDLGSLGEVAFYQGNLTEAQRYSEESLALHRRFGDQRSIAIAINNLGEIALRQGDLDRADALCHEGLAMFRELGDTRSAAACLNNLAVVHWSRGRRDVSRELHEESLTLYRELGDKRGMAHVLDDLALLARQNGDATSAGALYANSLALWQEVGDRRGTAECLAGLSGIARDQGDPIGAARLLGAAEELLESASAFLDHVERIAYEEDVAAVRTALGDDAYADALGQGRAMTVEQAVADLLGPARSFALRHDAP